MDILSMYDCVNLCIDDLKDTRSARDTEPQMLAGLHAMENSTPGINTISSEFSEVSGNCLAHDSGFMFSKILTSFES